MTSACLAGSTGLVGGNILTTLNNLAAFSTVHTFSRKDLPPNPKLQPIISSDSSTWPKQFPANVTVFFSGLGTTRGQAGSIENQRKIDYDLNLELARAAKTAGTKIYVLISTGGASASSPFAYTKMKGELEEAVKALEFDHTIILRPGLILGARETLRPPEFVSQKIAGFMGAISGGLLKDSWAADADVIAKAAVRAGLDALEAKQKDKVRMVYHSEIMRLGKKEWQE
ncbi:hypothetical protein K431DRAFT_286963 [Polychaeton citri CBS 116435]|uniref:NAD(P)-binding domain-containing protein n=1 Tax=Polychaeton citri CBS 116435 TaxID=1314669 RepID=A0A9P4Q6G6_9PEZI|nr:hypothetical protein K431DRAFT_286963 [Polychaeton citri CBS 116435]